MNQSWVFDFVTNKSSGTNAELFTSGDSRDLTMAGGFNFSFVLTTLIMGYAPVDLKMTSSLSHWS